MLVTRFLSPPANGMRAGKKRGRALVVLLALAFVLCPLSLAWADLIIFKDGFLIHGRIKQDKVNFVDPVSGRVFTAAKLNGFYMVDDDARRIVFSASQVADATKQDYIHDADYMRLDRISRLSGGQKYDPRWRVDSVDSFGSNWERGIIMMDQNGQRVKIRQRITQLTPHYVRLEALYVDWGAYHLTREFGPDTLRTLVYHYLERKTKKPKLSESDKRFQVFRFLLQAGYYDHAEKELDDIRTDMPDEKYRVASSMKTLNKLRALQLVDHLELAHRAGQPKKVAALLARLTRLQIDAAEIGERKYAAVQGLREKYQAGRENLERAREFLSGLPGRIAHVGRRAAFKKAAETIAGELNLDTLPRLEGFIGLAVQEERDRKHRKRTSYTPAELMAVAVSGWLLGNDAAEGKVDSALRLWEARDFVLKYLKNSDALDRKNMLAQYSQDAGAALDEITQLIRSLPPTDPYDPTQPKENIPKDKKPPTKDKGQRTKDKGQKTSYPTEPIQLNTLGRGRGSKYHIQLPPEYHPHRAYPVLFVLHSRGSSPSAMLKRWSSLAAQHGYFLVAPEWSDSSDAEYRYSEEEHRAVLDTLRDLRRRFQIDSDRVFLFGFEEGGNMAFDVGLAHPDLFAGVIPMAAMPRYFCYPYWPNAQYLPFYVVDGSFNLTNPKWNRKQFQEWVRCHYPAIYVEYKGRSAEWFEGELPYIFDWMSYKKRAHPRHELGRDGGGGFFGQEFKTMRTGDNRFYWLSTDGIKDGYLNEAGKNNWKTTRTAASMTAHVGSNNDVYVNTKGLSDITVWFPPALVNFERPVTIRVNGPVSFKKIIKPNLGVLLEDFRSRGDRQNLMLAKEMFRIR